MLAVCLDVSDVSVVDASGESVVDADRADIQSLSVSLTESETSGTGMRVEAIGPREGDPKCD